MNTQSLYLASFCSSVDGAAKRGKKEREKKGWKHMSQVKKRGFLVLVSHWERTCQVLTRLAFQIERKQYFISVPFFCVCLFCWSLIANRIACFLLFTSLLHYRYASMHACVPERERERDRGTDRERQRQRRWDEEGGTVTGKYQHQ